MNENAIGTIVVDCAVELRRDLGPGLLERVYEVTLARALERRGLSVQRQAGVTIEYRGERFEEGLRADLIVGKPRSESSVSWCLCERRIYRTRRWRQRATARASALAMREDGSTARPVDFAPPDDRRPRTEARRKAHGTAQSAWRVAHH
jgi:hypothetical protein